MTTQNPAAIAQRMLKTLDKLRGKHDTNGARDAIAAEADLRKAIDLVLHGADMFSEEGAE